MKKCSLYTITLALLLACNDKPAKPVSNSSASTIAKKQDVALVGWSQKEKDSMMKRCVATVSRQWNEGKATTYCSCMFQKMEAKYPDKDSLKLLKMSEMMKMAKECIK